ncbi:MAG TPA: hypothetical protein VKV32_07400 [Stellaceae bacterium]|nr:hypothetical protein [Stellaceae bacterium]
MQFGRERARLIEHGIGRVETDGAADMRRESGDHRTGAAGDIENRVVSLRPFI